LSGVLTWTSGQIGVNGSVLTVAANSVLVLAGVNGTDYVLQGTVTNAGTVQLVSGNLDLFNCSGQGLLMNLPGGLVQIMADVSIVNGCSGEFVNQGLLVKSGGTNS